MRTKFYERLKEIKMNVSRQKMLYTVFFFGVLQTHAQQTINITTTAAPFLRISADARAGGMGDLALATHPDVAAVFYNRAKLPFTTSRTGIGLSYTPWLHDVTSDMYLLTAAAYHQLNPNSALSFSLRYFNMGDVPVQDYNGTKLSTAHPRELALDLGYSIKLSHRLGLATAMRYINSKLVSGYINGNNYQAAGAVAVDVSLYYNGIDSTKGGWSAGLALSNLGSKLNYTNDATRKEFLPANAGVGVAYTYIPDEDNRIMVGLDLNHLMVPKTPVDSSGLNDYYNKGAFYGWSSSFSNGNYQWSVGAEYTYHRQFSIRAGYLIVSKDAGDNGGFTAGVGLHFSAFGLNLSYLAESGKGVTRNPLSNTLRFGVNFGFGN